MYFSISSNMFSSSLAMSLHSFSAPQAMDVNYVRGMLVFSAQLTTTASQAGITTADAVNIFLRKAITASGFPFEVTAPKYNAETLAAMEEARLISRDPNAKSYANFTEILDEIDKEIEEEKTTAKEECLACTSH